MRQREAKQYAKTGVLAVDPRAFFEMFFMEREERVNDESDARATVVTIRGPLDQHDDGWCDSYESILRRVAAACESTAPAIVLRIDSPGGDAAGCFDCAREIRAMTTRAGKQLVSYVDGKAGSAAYAIACTASRIIMSDVALVGSIGVISTRPDYSMQNAMRGFRLGFVTSGARKADGHPDSAITDAELAASQAVVDSMAAVFFELVSEMRGLPVETIAALEAGVFHGDAARAAGLADESLTLKATLASLASWNEQTTDEAQMAAVQAKAEDKDKKPDEGKDEAPFDSVRSRLEEMAKGDDANAKAAKRALAELNKDTEAEDPKKDEPAAAAPGATPEESAAAAMRAALKAQQTVDGLKAELATEKELRERDAAIAARSDLSAEMRGLLQKSPLALVKETLEGIKAPEGKGAKSATGGVSAAAALAASAPGGAITRGDTQEGDSLPPLDPAIKAKLDKAFGLGGTVPKAGNVHNTPFRLTLGGTESDPAPAKQGAA